MPFLILNRSGTGLGGAGGGGASGVDLTNTDNDSQTGVSQATYTFSAKALGAADANREIIVAFAGRSASTSIIASSVTIGGVSATLVKRQAATGASHTAEIWRANVPTGTTGDIVITWSLNVLRMGISVFRLLGATLGTEVSAGSNADTSVGALTIPTGGGAIGGGYAVGSATAASAATPTGFNEDTELVFGGTTWTAAHSAGGVLTGSQNLTFTWSSFTSGSNCAVFAAWGT